MTILQNDYYTVVKRIISTETALIGGTELEMIRNIEAVKNDKPIQFYTHADELVTEKNFSWYAPFFGEAVLKETTELAGQIAGKQLIPSYSYGRIYYPGAVMKGHLDRPSCEYSMTIPLKIYGDPWNIKIKTKEGETKEIALDVGDAMFYQGDKVWHWRDPYVEGETQVQLFLHWIDANGQHTDYALDRRGILGSPAAEEIIKMKERGEL